jgi:hypothetical protein
MNKFISNYSIPDNPYKLIEDSSTLKKFERILGIDESKIFTPVKKEDDDDDKVISMLVCKAINAINVSGAVSWLGLKTIHFDSCLFIKNQLCRLKSNPKSFPKELYINLIVFACMGYVKGKWIRTQKTFSDATYFGLGLLSSKLMAQWAKRMVFRDSECVRWVYSSSILLIIHYIALSMKYGYSYDLKEMKAICDYLVTLNRTCKTPLKCFLVDYKKPLIFNERNIHDILLRRITPKELSNGIQLSSDDERIISRYCCEEMRTTILSDIEKEQNEDYDE